MSKSMIVMALMKFALTSGFAYIIWILAAKENDPVKVIGQGIAVVIAVFAILSIAAPGPAHRSEMYINMGMQHPESRMEIHKDITSDEKETGKRISPRDQEQEER
jgi:hypothetical protein